MEMAGSGLKSISTPKRVGYGRGKNMKKTISQLLNEIGSVYIPATKDGSSVIRLSGHLPAPDRLRYGDITGSCKNIYMIFLRSKIAIQTRIDNAILSELVKLIDSNDPAEKRRGEIGLNNILVLTGKDIGKGINYQIIDGKSEYEIATTIKAVTKMLKTFVFKPLEYI
jgi:hypothetical protein